MSQITTHVLDTAVGKPAMDLEIALEKMQDDHSWKVLGHGKTNSDGRITDLLTKDHSLESGVYRMNFNTKSYFQRTETKSFYPFAHVIFQIQDDQLTEHFHVPLLLNPFGYSTYRGS